MTTPEKITALREKMKTQGIDAFIIFSADPHMSEYLPSHWQERSWLSGFTGSAGFVIVTTNKAGLWTDSRYFVQAPKELADSGIELYKQGVDGFPDEIEFLKNEVPQGGKVGVNSLTTSHANWEKIKNQLSSKNIVLVDAPLLDEIWTNRPQGDSDPVFVHPLKYAGKSIGDKLSAIRSEMQKSEATTHIITALDDVAWTLNLRGNDVAFNPVFLGYILLNKQETKLFIDKEKITPEVESHLKEANVSVENYSDFFKALKNLKDEKILLSEQSNQAIFEAIQPNNECIIKPTPGNLLKAIKNEKELEGFRKVMVRDGVALVKFFYWLKNSASEENLTEYSLGKKLREFRATGKNFKGESFGSIIGYRGNGAIVHYSAKKEESATIKAESSILVDSGGQYTEGTTDITRTFALGEVSQAFKDDYTLVLKGMIQLSLAQFPKGTRGTHLDTLARLPLWQQGKDYGHGTGHGVGSFMNVHEGPQNIRKDLNDVALQPGMVLSNEPGLYIEDRYGIRIENLIAVKEKEITSFGTFYAFETLTLFPIFLEHQANLELLNDTEKQWLNNYHQQVQEALAPHLDGEEKEWLLHITQPI